MTYFGTGKNGADSETLDTDLLSRVVGNHVMPRNVAHPANWRSRFVKLLYWLSPNLNGAAIGLITYYQLADGAHVRDWVTIVLVTMIGLAACAVCGRSYRRVVMGK